MKNSIKTLVGIVLAVALYTGASAHTRGNSTYISLSGLTGWHNDTEFSGQVGNVKILNAFQHKQQFGGTLALGRSFGCWRTELETSYRHLGIDKVKVVLTDISTGQSQSISARLGEEEFNFHNLGVMANIFYDIPVAECLSLYLGGGIGASFVFGEIKTVEQDFFSNTTKTTRDAGYIDTVFAYQAMAGVTFHVNQCVDLYTGYRLIGTTKPDFDGSVKPDNLPLSHNIEAGIRFNF